MFSLIITIISIALVAALALATLYYGGDAFHQGQAKAQATKTKLQAQQLLAASVLYKVNHGHFPDAIADMVPEYLKTIPVAQASAVSQALAAAEEWTMVTPGEPVFAVTTTSVETCQNINESSYGAPGVLTEAVTDYQVQCFGTSSENLTTLASLNAESLTIAAAESPSTITVSTEGVPTSPTDEAWLVSPCSDCMPIESGGESPAADVGGTGDGILTVSTAPLVMGDPYSNENVIQLVLQNTGTGPLNITQAPASSNPSFAVSTVWGSTCAPIPVGGSCFVQVDFNPSAVGTQTGNLTFDTDGGAPVSISMSGTSTAHVAVGVWSSDPASTVAIDTSLDPTPVNIHRDAWVYLRNSGMDGILASGFTLVGDTQHFTINAAPQKYYASNPYSGLAAGCGLNGAATATTGECAANKAFSAAPNGYAHLGLIVKYRPLSAGSHSVQLIPNSSTSTVPAPLTFTGSGY